MLLEFEEAEKSKIKVLFRNPSVSVLFKPKTSTQTSDWKNPALSHVSAVMSRGI